MQAAGIGEGYATASHIATLFANMMPITFSSGAPPKAVTDFLNTQEAWAKSQVAAKGSDNFWQMSTMTLSLSGAQRNESELEQAAAVLC